MHLNTQQLQALPLAERIHLINSITGIKPANLIGTIDSLICATAQHHNLTLVTRNTKDFAYAQVLLIDPWQ